MTSAQNTAWLASKANPRVTWSGAANFQGVFVAKDVVTTDGGEAVDQVIRLFGPGLNMAGCEIIPELTKIRTGGTTGTISYAGKIQRVTADGTATDVTGSITLNRTIPTVAAAAVKPQTPLAKDEYLQLKLTGVTTPVTGVTWSIELFFTKRNAPGMA